MTAAPASDFDSAIEQALSLSARHDAAYDLVRCLTRELAQTVSSRTQGVVTIALVATGGAALASFVARMAGEVSGPRVGLDDEDRQVRQLVRARAKSGESRTLWEVEFADTGYPVTLRGPEHGASVTCFSDEDVRDGFVSAAAHGIVGRKLAALVAHEQQKLVSADATGSPPEQLTEPGE